MTRDELLSLFPELRSKLVASLRRLVSADEAEDLAEETLLRALTAVDEFREDAAPGTWLHRIGVNLALDLLRQRQQHPASAIEMEGNLWDAPDPDTESTQTGDQIEQRQMSECVRDLMAKLPPEHRHVLIQADMLERTAPEIARDAGLATGNVKIRLHRARRAMKTVLETHCEFDHGLTGVRCCVPKTGV